MKKIIFSIIILSFLSLEKSFSQASRVIGPVERKMTDSLCISLNKLDISKITTKQEAVAAYTQCVGEHADLLADLAKERNVDISDVVEMKKVGIDLAFDLFKMKCATFTKLSMLMAMKNSASESSNSDVTIGVLKRIDSKGFNYLVIVENNNEKSFLWLRQFPGSEKFMNGVSKYAGEKVKITWQNIEIYLPQSKGYYNVKEIKNLEFF